MEPGESHEIKLSPLSTSDFSGPGHRVRTVISGSDLRRFARGLHTIGDIWREARGVVTHKVIWLIQTYPSQIRLPILLRPAS